MPSDPVQDRIHIAQEEMETPSILPTPTTAMVEDDVNIHGFVDTNNSAHADPVQARIRAELMQVHAQAEIQRAENPPQKEPAPDAPDGMTQAALDEIAKGNPDPATPEHPSEISPIKQMGLPELQVFVLALEAKISYLETRFVHMVSENFKEKY